MDLLVDLLKIGGTTALAVGVLYLLYRQLLDRDIFPKLTRRQAFMLLMTLIVLVFLVVLMAFIFTGGTSINFSTVSNSSGVNVDQ